MTCELLLLLLGSVLLELKSCHLLRPRTHACSCDDVEGGKVREGCMRDTGRSDAQAHAQLSACNRNRLPPMQRVAWASMWLHCCLLS